MPSVPTSGSTPPPVWDAVPQAGSVHYAGFWIRVMAAIFDGVVLAIVWWIILLFLPTQPIPTLPPDPDFEAVMQFVENLSRPRETIIYAVLVWAYFAFQESSSAQGALGKRMLGIRVGREDGGRLSLGTATVRAWPIYLPGLATLAGTGVGSLVMLIALISCLVVAFSSRKQGLHDRMAGALLTRR
jgi:uncharacterized RDD family membrane protein YckC